MKPDYSSAVGSPEFDCKRPTASQSIRRLDNVFIPLNSHAQTGTFQHNNHEIKDSRTTSLVLCLMMYDHNLTEMNKLNILHMHLSQEYEKYKNLR